VGAIAYDENYFLTPKESWSDQSKFKLYFGFMHEVAHMWFGNLVTISWWNDLWLKESFANYLALINLIENPDLKLNVDPELIFVRWLKNAIEADTKKTTHPIQVKVLNTEDAGNAFGVISYQKGACFLKQLNHYVGRDILKTTMKDYLTKFAHKDT